MVKNTWSEVKEFLWEGVPYAIVFGGILLLVLGVLGLSALVTWGCWNALMPYIFGLPRLALWQAFLLNVLMGVLLRSRVTVHKN